MWIRYIEITLLTSHSASLFLCNDGQENIIFTQYVDSVYRKYNDKRHTWDHCVVELNTPFDEGTRVVLYPARRQVGR